MRDYVNFFYPTIKDEFIYLCSKDCDLLNYHETLSIFEKYKPEIVIHLAANVGGLYKNLNQNLEMFEDNLQMNLNIFKICNEFKVKKLIDGNKANMAEDHNGSPVFLARNSWRLDKAKEDNPDLKFLKTKEQLI